MKKIFAFLFASALLATGLISCGGGSGDNKNQYIVTGKDFEKGRGIAFAGNTPCFDILPDPSAQPVGGKRQPDNTGAPVHGTLSEDSPIGSSQYVKDLIANGGELTQEGRSVLQDRQIRILGGATEQCRISYIYTQQGYAVCDFSLSANGTDNKDFINAFGLEQIIKGQVSDKFEVNSLGGSNVVFVIDWNSSYAELIVNTTARSAINIDFSTGTDDEATADKSDSNSMSVTVSRQYIRVAPYFE